MPDDKRITELPLASTPLAGVELAEIVQGGVNKRVPVDEFGGGAALTDGSGTTFDTDHVDLGGTQDANVDIDQDGNDFKISNAAVTKINIDGATGEILINAGQASTVVGADDGGTIASAFYVQSDQAAVSSDDGGAANAHATIQTGISVGNAFAEMQVSSATGGGSQATVTANENGVTLGTTSTNRLRIELDGSWSLAGDNGTAGDVLTSNGAGSPPTWEPPSGGGGITNGAAANELMMSDGTNADPSGVFKGTNLGDLDLGTGLTGAARKIAATGTASDVELVLESKGALGVSINPKGGNIRIGDNDGVISYSDFEAVQRDCIQNETSANGTTVYDITAGFFKKYYFYITSSVAKQVLLPSAATVSGAVSYRYSPTITFGITVGPNDVTLTPNGSDTINGASSYVISGATGFQYVTIVAIQGGYFVVGQN